MKESTKELVRFVVETLVDDENLDERDDAIKIFLDTLVKVEGNLRGAIEYLFNCGASYEELVNELGISANDINKTLVDEAERGLFHIVATNIKWDAPKKVRKKLFASLEIPIGLTPELDEDALANFISSVGGFCFLGCDVQMAEQYLPEDTGARIELLKELLTKAKSSFMEEIIKSDIDAVKRRNPKNDLLPGTKVRCIKMEDMQAVPSGTVGTVTHIDDIGTIHVNWATGSTLGLVPGVDKFEVVEEVG